MNSLALIFSPFALLLPLMAGQMDEPGADEQQAVNNAPRPELGFDPGASDGFGILQDARQPREQNQVRIERRVVIRISPSNSEVSNSMLADLPRRPLRSDFEEVDHGNCVPVEGIVGVQPTADNRLMLFMRDRKVITATLERACTARAFYSGFYVEQNEDGRLCVGRDRLQSRAGASCGVESLKRMIAVRG